MKCWSNDKYCTPLRHGEGPGERSLRLFYATGKLKAKVEPSPQTIVRTHQFGADTQAKADALDLISVAHAKEALEDLVGFLFGPYWWASNHSLTEHAPEYE